MHLNVAPVVFVLYIYRTKLIVRVGFELGTPTPEVQRLIHCSTVNMVWMRKDTSMCFAVLQFACVHLLCKIQMTKRSIKDLIIFIKAFLCLDTVFLSKYMQYNTKYIKYVR